MRFAGCVWSQRAQRRHEEHDVFCGFNPAFFILFAGLIQQFRMNVAMIKISGFFQQSFKGKTEQGLDAVLMSFRYYSGMCRRPSPKLLANAPFGYASVADGRRLGHHI